MKKQEWVADDWCGRICLWFFCSVGVFIVVMSLEMLLFPYPPPAAGGTMAPGRAMVIGIIAISLGYWIVSHKRVFGVILGAMLLIWIIVLALLPMSC
jgi:hypothetical protein